MNMINSADDLDLYNEYMYMYIDPDREYIIMKFIASHGLRTCRERPLVVGGGM